MIVNKLMMIIDDFDLQSSRLAGNHWKAHRAIEKGANYDSRGWQIAIGRASTYDLYDRHATI